MAIASNGTPEPVAFISNFEINATSDRYDVTSFGDTGKAYVAGLPDASGTFSGFFDDSTSQMYTAALDGVARPFYFYPNNTDTSKYWFGTGFFDQTATFPVDGAAALSGNWSAATDIIKVG
jgi:hypothetical protein